MKDLMRHRGEFARAIANKKYEFTDEGVLFSAQQLTVAGVMSDSLNGGPWSAGPNIIPTAALNMLLDQLVGGAVQVNPWYVALFSGNITPAATLTGPTFVATATEFVGYTGDRKAFVEAAAAAGVVDNTASRATFVMTAAGTIYGGALLSVATKSSAGAGDKILACARFAASRAVVIDDELAVKYTLSATST